jgi:hypothetical protein
MDTVGPGTGLTDQATLAAIRALCTRYQVSTQITCSCG